MTIESWKITFTCTQDVARQLSEDATALDLLDPEPLIVATEPDPATPDIWRIDAYVEGEPDEALLTTLLALVPGLTRDALAIEAIGAEDWVTLSQDGLEPISAGRFFVYTSQHADRVPPGRIAIHIDAGQAFGTGQHETTTGCLRMIDRIADAGGIASAIDIGTGTAILALAAKKALGGRIVATDIDPVAIEVSAENIALNGERVGDDDDAIRLAVADGPAHPLIGAHAPYDLVIANILAGPLIDMAAGIAALVAADGRLILAGLLDTQADAVLASYAPHGLGEIARISVGEWPTLMLGRSLRAPGVE